MSNLISRVKKKLLLHRAASLYKARSLNAIPSQLGVCLIDECNLRCPYCMRSKFTVPKGRFTVELIKDLLNRMPYIKGVCVMGLCEPLLNAEAPDIIRWLKENGYKISLTTNGTIRLTLNRLHALLSVDDFVFSIDSPDEKTFQILRAPGRLEQVIHNLNRLLAYKRDRGLGKTDNPPIHINAVITSHNFHQIPDLIRMLEKYADELTYLMVDPVSRPDYQDFEKHFILQTDYIKFIPYYRKLARDSPLQVVGLDWMFQKSSNWRDCPLAWNAMFVQPNGDAYFCYHYKHVLGNVFEDDPLKVWNSPHATKFRRKLRLGTPPLEQCRSCNFARTGWQPKGIYLNKAEDVN